VEKLEAGEIDTEPKRKELLGPYGEELEGKDLEWTKLESLVAGARNQRFLPLVERPVPKLAA